MNRSAARSSSMVVTPARTLPRRRSRQRARTRPAAAISSICSGVFGTINCDPSLQLALEPQRGQRGADVVVHLGRRAGAVEASQDPAVLVEVGERARLLAVDLEPVPDRVGVVVVALD